MAIFKSSTVRWQTVSTTAKVKAPPRDTYAIYCLLFQGRTLRLSANFSAHAGGGPKPHLSIKVLLVCAVAYTWSGRGWSGSPPHNSPIKDAASALRLGAYFLQVSIGSRADCAIEPAYSFMPASMSFAATSSMLLPSTPRKRVHGQFKVLYRQRVYEHASCN